MKGTIVEEIKSLVDAMFAVGLSPSLIIALKEIVEEIPPLTKNIHDGLLKQLSLILLRRPMPTRYLPPPKIDPPAEPLVVPTSDVQLTTLALNILGAFKFPEHCVELFLKFVPNVNNASQIGSIAYWAKRAREIRLDDPPSSELFCKPN